MTYYQIIHRIHKAVFGTYGRQDEADRMAASLNRDYQTDVYIVIPRTMGD